MSQDDPGLPPAEVTESAEADPSSTDGPTELPEPSAADFEPGVPELFESTALAATPMDENELMAALEAILFVVEAPVAVTALASAVQQPTEAVTRAIDRLGRHYDERPAGVELRHIAGGVRIYTRPAQAAAVEGFLLDGQRSRLTQAALETLAVIAYRQPVTRARVSAIRGVNVDGVVRTLSARGLIVEVGSDPDTGGGLFKTTELFLEKMGLQSLEELPSLAPLLPELVTVESEET